MPDLDPNCLTFLSYAIPEFFFCKRKNSPYKQKSMKKYKVGKELYCIAEYGNYVLKSTFRDSLFYLSMFLSKKSVDIIAV